MTDPITLRKFTDEISPATNPNVTYVAIGAAFNDGHGYQQHPPFLHSLLSEYPDWNFQIIIVDHLTEDPAEIANHFQLKKYDTDWYANERIQVIVIRSEFDFDSVIKHQNSESKTFIYDLINRTIDAKRSRASNDYLLFVHDFSGYSIRAMAESVEKCLMEQDEETGNLFRRNILIDLFYKEEGGCFPKLEYPGFGPHLYKSSNGTFEVFTPFTLTNLEISCILLHRYKNSCYLQLTKNVINFCIKNFLDEYIAIYRQLRMCLEGSAEFDLELIFHGKQTLTNELTNRIMCAKKCPIDQLEVGTDRYVDIICLTQEITIRLLKELKIRTSFLDFFGKDIIRDELFNSFVTLCNEPILGSTLNTNRYYQLGDKFRECWKNMDIFLDNVTVSNYSQIFVEYCTEYKDKYSRLPLCLELLCHDNQ